MARPLVDGLSARPEPHNQGEQLLLLLLLLKRNRGLRNGNKRQGVLLSWFLLAVMVDTILIEEGILPLAEDVSGHGIDLRTHGELMFCGVRLKKQVCLDPTSQTASS